MFLWESNGITHEESAYDTSAIQKFRNSIKLNNGYYYIDLPWKTDVIGRVPTNFHLSKIIAQKVSYNNSKQNLDNNYFKIFNKQLKLGIIKKI